MVDTVLHLSVPGGDDFYFTSFEVPQDIPMGGRQMLATHKLVGGRRIVDAMGPDDKPLQWSGIMLGKSAQSRTRYLDYLRKTGVKCTLSWSEYIYTIVVESFDADFQRTYKIPYKISCLVVADQTEPINVVPRPSLDDVMRDDIGKALAAGALLGDTALSRALAALDAAARKMASFANKTSAALASVTGPLQQAQDRLNAMAASASSIVGTIGTLGGNVTGTPVAAQAAKFTSSVTAAVQLPTIQNLSNITTRMAKNLGVAK